MIDTDLGFNQTQIPEHRLLASVVIHALRDSCQKPITPYGKKHPELTFDATTAHDFLWTEALDAYLHYLDIDPYYFRQSLIKTMDDDSDAKIGEFSSTDRRAFRANKRIWESNQQFGLVKPLANPESVNWGFMETSSQQGVRQITRKYIGADSGGKATFANNENPEGK